MLKYLGDRPMLFCGLLFTAICVVGYYCSFAAFITAIVFIIIAFVLIYLKRNFVWIFISFLTVVLCSSVLVTKGDAKEIIQTVRGNIKGNFTVVSEPEYHGNYSTAVFESNRNKNIKDGVKIKVSGNFSQITMGDGVYAEMGVSEIKGKFKSSNYAEKVYLTGYINKIEKRKTGDEVLSFTQKIRSFISERLFENMKYNEAGVMMAITTGNRNFLSDDMYGLIKSAGVAHVMVVSGMHLSIIISIISLFADFFFKSRFAKTFLILLSVLFMVNLCGYTKSILRAGIFCIIYSVGVLLNRTNTPENTLGTTVAAILICSPFSVFGISFNLSVLSTLGIVSCSLPIIRYVAENEIIENKFVLALFSSATVSIFALIFTLPTVIYTYGFISTVSVFTNLYISPVVTLALSSCAVIVFADFILPFNLSFLYSFPELLIKYVIYVIKFFGSQPFATVNIGQNGFIISIALAVFIICCLLIFAYLYDKYRCRKIILKKYAETKGGKYK